MKRLFIIPVILSASLLFAGSIYVMEKGGRAAIATTNAKGDKVVGINKNVSSILRIEQGSFTISIPIKSFDFDDYRLIDHFAGEDYLDANKEPMIFINAKIPGAADMDFSKLDEKHIELNGELKIRGITKTHPINITLNGSDEGISGQLSLSKIELKDFGIEVSEAVEAELGDGFRMTCAVTWKKIEAPKKK